MTGVQRAISIAVLIFLFTSVPLSAQTASFDVFAVSDLVKVFEDGYNLPSPENGIDLFGIRNEIVSGQLVIVAYENLANASVAIERLTHEKSSASIEPENVNWNFVGSVPLRFNTDRARGKSMVRPAPAR